MTSQGHHRVKRQDIDKAECSSRKKVGDRSWLAKLSDWLQSDTGAIVIPVSAVVILCWIIASCVTFCAKPWDKCCGIIWSCRCCSVPKSGTTSQKVTKQSPAQELQKKESSSSIDSSDSSSSSGSSIATVVFSETSVWGGKIYQLFGTEKKLRLDLWRQRCFLVDRFSLWRDEKGKFGGLQTKYYANERGNP